MKKIMTFSILSAVVFVGILIALSLFLDTAIKNGAETFGPKLTGGPVTFEKVSLNILSGSGEITGITIGNPKGFTTDAAIKLKSIQFAIEPKSLLGNRIRINKILIDGPQITHETSLKGSNINRIMANIQAATGSKNSNKADTPSKEQSAKKLLIDDLLIKNGQIRMSATIMKGNALDLAMPEIHLQDIGKKSGGASIAEVTMQIFSAINKGVSSEVSNSGKILGNTEGVKSFLKGLGNAITGGN